MSELILKIITPKSSFGPFPCDSIHLSVADNVDNKGGGSYGIRKGHTNALLALEKGCIKAFSSKGNILTGNCGDGFATVDENTVTVVVEYYNDNN